MKPTAIFVFSLCTWALCNFWLLPMAKARWNAVNLRGKVGKAGSLVVLEKARDLSAISALVLAVVISSIWIAEPFSSTSVSLPLAMIAALGSLYEATKNFGEEYGAALGFIAISGAAVALYVASRQAKSAVLAAWSAKAQEVHERLKSDSKTLDTARADPDLAPLVAKFDELVGALVAHDSGVEGGQFTPSQLSEARDQAGRIFSALAVEIAQKELKFDEIINKSSAEVAPPKGRWQRLMRIVASDRLTKDLGLVKKPLSYVTTGLLVLSLVGWSAEPLANSLQLAVNNLRINLLDKKAQQELAQAVSNAPEPTPEPMEEAASASASTVAHTVQGTVRILARASIDGMARSGALDHMAHVDRPPASEAEFVRSAINDQHIDVAPLPEDAAKVRQEVSESIGKTVDGSISHAKAQEDLEHALMPEVQRFHDEQPGKFQQWASRIERRYSTPMGAMDAQGKLLAQMIDEVFTGLDGKPTTELGKQAQKLAKDFGKDSIKTWAQSWAKTWVTDSIISDAKPEVASSLNRFVFEASPESKKFVADLGTAEGRGWVGSIEQQQDAKAVRAVADKVASLSPPEAREMLKERLGGYDQLFPLEAPNPTGDGIGSGSGSGGGGVGGGGGGGERGGRSSVHASVEAPHTSGTKVGFAQSRATSFRLASRSFRVRGVLVGQDMQTSDIDVDGLRWSIQPSKTGKTTKLDLAVHQRPGWRDLGVFDAGVVNQALRYAADRRVVATTITPGDGKVVGRVTYLHPALVDTPLGCRVVEADRLIDTFTFAAKGERLSPPMATLRSDREQMGQWMMVAKLAEALAPMPEARACPREDLQKVIGAQHLMAVHFSPALEQSLSDFIAAENKKLPGSTRVLNVAQKCSGAGPSNLASCLCESAKGSGLPASYWFPEDHTSQFREKAVKGNPDWAWMQRSTNRLENVDLWVHTTFSLRRSEARDGEVDEATASSVDFPAVELQTLRQEISVKLPSYLRDSLASPSYDDFTAPVEDFILLQRLFRSALAGGLGRDFPMTQLVTLQRQTRKYVPTQPTIRWEPASLDSDLPKTLVEADVAAAKSYERWRVDMMARHLSHAATCDRVSN